MKINRLYENKEFLTISDLQTYRKVKHLLYDFAFKYVKLHEDELDEDMDDWRISDISIGANIVYIEVQDINHILEDDFEISSEKFIHFCDNFDEYAAAKKYNL